VLGRSDAANRNGAGRGAGGAGVGHDGARDNRGHAHQLAHVALHTGDVLSLRFIFSVHVEVIGQLASPAQTNRRWPRWGRIPLDDGANGDLVSPNPARALSGRNGLGEPRSGLIAPADQALASDFASDFASDHANDLASDHAGFLAQTHGMSRGSVPRAVAHGDAARTAP